MCEGVGGGFRVGRVEVGRGRERKERMSAGLENEGNSAENGGLSGVNGWKHRLGVIRLVFL